MRPLLDGTKIARAALIGDVVAILMFLLFGVSSHHEDAVSRYLTLAGRSSSGRGWGPRGRSGRTGRSSNARLAANLAIGSRSAC